MSRAPRNGPARTDDGTGDAAAADVNSVELVGRLAATAQRRELPSGDMLVTFRIIVDRPAGERGRVDSIDCVTVRARPRRVIERACAGERIAVSGALRRRFWRGPGGTQSRYAVDVARVRRLPSKPGSVTPARPGRRAVG
jgi:single-strand DNA-binding protein